MSLMSVSVLFKFHLTSVPPKAGEHIYKLCYDCVNSAPPNCALKVRLSPILGQTDIPSFCKYSIQAPKLHSSWSSEFGSGDRKGKG